MLLSKININSVDVSSYVVNYEIEKTHGEAITQVDIKLLKTIGDVLALETGQTIEIWRGWTTSTDVKVFSGYIESYAPEAGIVKVIGKDKLWDLIRKEVTHTYDKNIDTSAGKISAIFEDLVETYGGLTATVQDSGTTQILEKFVCNHVDIFDRCKALAEALDWQFYYRADTDIVYFEPKGFGSNSNILTVGGNVIGVPKWTYDNTEMANDLTIAGAYQEIETTESGQIGVTAGYAPTGIEINFTPISVKLYMDASNPPTTLKVGGLPNSTATYDYYVDKSPNQTQKSKLVPATAFTGNHYAEVRYSHAVPIPIHMYSQVSIDSYGQFKKTVTFTDIRSVADAETRGTNYLIKYATPFIYSTLKVSTNSDLSLDTGQIINVVDGVNVPNVNSNLVVTRLRMRYPSDYDEIEVGDKRWRLTEWQAVIEEKLKRLMEDEIQNQDIVTELLTFDTTNDYPLTITPRYRKVITQTIDGTTMVWDSTENCGKWGTGKWGGNAFGAETNNFVQQYNNRYEETFIDTDFKSLFTTATWDTTGKKLDFTAGQAGLSSYIDYNNGTITQAKITITGTGSYLIQLTANGTNLETCTSGVAHTFTNTGTKLAWKITENGSSTGSITKIVVEDYH